jgi:hypothetical protein
MKPPVDIARIFHVLVDLVSRPGLKEEEDNWGACANEYAKILYDPNGFVPRILVHESTHFSKDRLEIKSASDEADERAVYLVEMAICEFVMNNPLLSLWIIKELIIYANGIDKWREVLSEIESPGGTAR